MMVRTRGQSLTGAEESGDGAAVLRYPPASRLDDQTAKPGMQRIPRDLFGERAFGAKLMEQIFGMFHGRRGRSVEPFQRIEAADPCRAQEKRSRRKIFARD